MSKLLIVLIKNMSKFFLPHPSLSFFNVIIGCFLDLLSMMREMNSARLSGN